MGFVRGKSRAAADAVVVYSDGMQWQFIPICLVVRNEVGHHLAQCAVQPLNHAVGLCVGDAGESLHGPKHAGDFSADRGHELWTSVAKESVGETPSRDVVVYQLGCATLSRLLVSR